MFKKSLVWLMIVVLFFGVVTGCSSSPQQGENQSTRVEEDAQTAENNAKTTYPITVTDDTKQEVKITKEPQRIISLVPSHTESLFALGLDKKVVAVTKYDNYPADVQQKVEYSFEDSLNPNSEQIVALKPDLIVLGAHNPDLIENLKKLNIPVVKYDPQNIEAVYQTIDSLGKITNQNQKASEIVKEMKEKEKSIEEKIATIKKTDKKRVFVEVSPELFTPGKGTFMDELVQKAGGVNIATDAGWIQLNEEKIIQQNPQVILDTYGYYDKNAKANILTRKNWSTVDAIQQKQVVDLDSDLVTRPGPRIIDGLETIAKAIYPELFK